VGTAKQAQMVMGLSEYELLRAQSGMGMGMSTTATVAAIVQYITCETLLPEALYSVVANTHQIRHVSM
jgi:hypothetical protein